MKKLTITLIIIFSSFLVFGQKNTLSGKVTDANTGETLFGVNIILKEKNVGTTSNEYGFYSLDIQEGTHTILFSYLGYTSIEKQIELSKNTTLNIKLQEESTTLNEVVISAEESKARSKIKSAQMSVMQLSAKTVKKIPVVFGETDILRTITLMPGVSNAGEATGGFNVRGGAADQNLILLDEATIYNTSHLYGLFSVFNIDAIKDIKLYKGGIPSRFGGRVSSVLDVRQKDGNNQEFHLAGGIGLISSRLMAEGPLKKDKGSFLIAGRTSYANLFLKIANKDNRVSFYDLNTKLSYELNDNNKLFLSGYFGRDDMSFGEDLQNDYGNATANLRWNHIFNSKLFSNLSLIYSKYDYDLNLGENVLVWKSDIENYNLKYDFDYNISNSVKVNFGAQTQFFDFNPGEITIKGEDETSNIKLDKKQANESAAYIGVSHKLSDKLSVDYGLRTSLFFNIDEKVQEYENNQPLVFNPLTGIYSSGKKIEESTSKKTTEYYGLEPRVSLSYQFNDNNSFKASYQRTKQYMHLISNTNAPFPLDVWMPSGHFIKPQTSNQYAIGFFRNFNDAKYTIEIESFYKTVDNRIDYIDNANIQANNTIETELLSGKSRSYGLEFLLQKNTGRLTGTLAYTLSRSEQRTPGRTPEETGINNGKWYKTVYDRTHDVSLATSYKLSDQWTLGANFLYQTGRPTNYANGVYTFDDYNIPIFLGRNEDKLPDYHRLDVSATYSSRKNKNRKWKSEWVLGIYNLYSRKNAASITFTKNDDTGINEAKKTYVFPILPAISYNFKF